MQELRRVHIPCTVLKIDYQVKSTHYWFKELCVKMTFCYKKLDPQFY